MNTNTLQICQYECLTPGPRLPTTVLCVPLCTWHLKRMCRKANWEGTQGHDIWISIAKKAPKEGPETKWKCFSLGCTPLNSYVRVDTEFFLMRLVLTPVGPDVVKLEPLSTEHRFFFLPFNRQLQQLTCSTTNGPQTFSRWPEFPLKDFTRFSFRHTATCWFEGRKNNSCDNFCLISFFFFQFIAHTLHTGSFHLARAPYRHMVHARNDFIVHWWVDCESTVCWPQALGHEDLFIASAALLLSP